ncbi:MAG TPA: PstS family phosphate ABC transporter substrate-binding protein [Pseudolysinimonas sp.]|nr:PstS family phosphate ABC transporter substrate-binding protein [Pseudolysinimonas sp.]
MNSNVRKITGISASLVAAALLLTACGGQAPAAEGDGLSGSVVADGSSTVAPLAEAAGEQFRDIEAGVNVTVATSGTGGGFAAFCAGETDISNASREIKPEEAAICEEAGIEFTEIIIANDGLAVVVNADNDWADELTVEQLNKIWAPESEGVVMSWSDVDPSFPDVPLALFGAGTDSGTFDYFTKAINGEEGAIRADYSPSEDDNITVQGVAGAEGGIGFFGLSYVEENTDVIKAVAVDGVLPTVETVQDGTYTPLGRPLFIYVANASYTDKPQVKAFVDYFVENAVAIAEEALFVPLVDDQITTATEELASIG